MLTAFAFGIKIFFAFLGFILMTVIALGMFTLILGLIEARKNKDDEE